MGKKVEIRARQVVKAAVESFLDALARRFLPEEVAYLQGKVACATDLLLLPFSDGSGIHVIVSAVFLQHLTAAELQVEPWASLVRPLTIDDDEGVGALAADASEALPKSPALKAKYGWCFNNTDENDVTMRLLADGRVTLLHMGRTIEVPAPVVQSLVASHNLELFEEDAPGGE